MVALLSHENVCFGVGTLIDYRMELPVFVFKRGDHIDIYEISNAYRSQGTTDKVLIASHVPPLVPSVVKLTRTN